MNAYRRGQVASEPRPAMVRPDGCIEIEDRSSGIVISGGENVAPIEVEGCC